MTYNPAFGGDVEQRPSALSYLRAHIREYGMLLALVAIMIFFAWRRRARSSRRSTSPT